MKPWAINGFLVQGQNFNRAGNLKAVFLFLLPSWGATVMAAYSLCVGSFSSYRPELADSSFFFPNILHNFANVWHSLSFDFCNKLFFIKSNRWSSFSVLDAICVSGRQKERLYAFFAGCIWELIMNWKYVHLLGMLSKSVWLHQVIWGRRRWDTIGFECEYLAQFTCMSLIVFWFSNLFSYLFCSVWISHSCKCKHIYTYNLKVFRLKTHTVFKYHQAKPNCDGLGGPSNGH